MTEPERAASMPDSYFALVKRFPLTHIRDRRHHDRALALADELSGKKLDLGSQEYLDALSDLIATYEDDHVPVPDASEADVLRELCQASGHTQLQLARCVGISQSTLSALLSGQREMTKGHMVALAKYFNVPPAVFLPS